MHGAGYAVITCFILFYLGVYMNIHPYFPHFLAELGEIRYRYVRNVEQLCGQNRCGENHASPLRA